MNWNLSLEVVHLMKFSFTDIKLPLKSVQNINKEQYSSET